MARLLPPSMSKRAPLAALVVLAALAAAAHGACQPEIACATNLAPRETLTTAGLEFVSRVATVDLHRDRQPEILVADRDGDNAYWIERHPILGSVFHALPHAVGASFAAPLDISGMDLNRDGRPDLGVSDSQGLHILYQTTGMVFSPTLVFGGPASAHAFEPVGRAADGLPDIAVAGPRGVSWIANQATIPALLTTAVSQEPAHAIAWADLDGDSEMDIVWTTTGGAVQWFSRTTGLVLTVGSARGAFRLAFGDFDSNGRLDVAVTATNINVVRVFYQDAAGGAFVSRTVAGVPMDGPSGLASADLNADGMTDLLFTSLRDNSLVLAHIDAAAAATSLQALTNLFDTSTVAGGFSRAYDVAVVDYDRDGSFDFIVGDTSNIVLLRSTCCAPIPETSTLSTSPTTSPSTRPVTSASTSPTTSPDVTSPTTTPATSPTTTGTTSASTSATTTLLPLVVATPCAACATPQFARSPMAAVPGLSALTATDLNRDGHLDFVSGGNAIMLHEYLAAGVYATEVLLSVRAEDVLAVNLDGDRDVDILYTTDSTLGVLRRDKGSLARVTLATGLDGARQIETGDLNNDGRLDIVVRGNNRIYWFRQEADHAFTQFILSSISQPTSLRIADMNGDGFLDVVATLQAGFVVWFEHNRAASPVFFVRVAGMGLNQPLAVGAADLDGDGRPEIVTASAGDGQVIVHRATSPAATEFDSLTIGFNQGATSLEIVDLNNDGRPDIAVAAATAATSSVVWYEQQASGLFLSRLADFGDDGAQTLLALDHDLDGDLDLVTLSAGTQSATMLTSSCCPTEGQTTRAPSTAAPATTTETPTTVETTEGEPTTPTTTAEPATSTPATTATTTPTTVTAAPAVCEFETEVIVDANNAAGVQKLPPTGWSGLSHPLLVNGNFLLNTGPSNDATEVLVPASIAGRGTFAVFVSFVAARTLASNAIVQIRSTEGTTEVRVDQTQAPNQAPEIWHQLGTGPFTFDGSDGQGLSFLTRDANRLVLVDAVRFGRCNGFPDLEGSTTTPAARRRRRRRRRSSTSSTTTTAATTSESTSPTTTTTTTTLAERRRRRRRRRRGTSTTTTAEPSDSTSEPVRRRRRRRRRDSTTTTTADPTVERRRRRRRSAAASSDTLFRISCGASKSFVDGNGDKWRKGDDFFKGGSASSIPDIQITKTKDDEIFLSERAGDMSYAFPVTPGKFEVRLFFAEVDKSAAANGARLFDVVADGKTKLKSFDIFKAAGELNRAVSEDFKVTVSGDELKLEFEGVEGQAKVNAIQILSA